MRKQSIRTKARATIKKAMTPEVLKARRERCWDYFITGMSYRDIAAQKDIVVSHTQVASDVKAFVEELRQLDLQKVDQRRQLQIERMNVAMMSLWPNVLNGQVDAIREMRGLMSDEAKLLGLNAPTKVDITSRLAEMAERDGFALEEAIVEATYTILEEAS